MKITFSILVFFVSINLCIGQAAKDSFYYKKIAEPGVKFISVYNRKYQVFTQKIGKGKIASSNVRISFFIVLLRTCQSRVYKIT